MLNILQTLLRKLTLPFRHNSQSMSGPQAGACMKRLYDEGFVGGNFDCKNCGDTSVMFIPPSAIGKDIECDECGSVNTEWEELDNEATEELIRALKED